MPQRVLITGGSGFVGACLAHELVARQHEVHLLLRPQYQQWRLRDIAGKFIPHTGDLRDLESIRRAVSAAQPEVIFNLAVHGAYPAQRDRATILQTNWIGTANLLEALEGHDYQRLVHAGSSSEYGHKQHPMRECDAPEPRNDYAVTKAASSMLCLSEAYKGKPVCVVRIFSAYGPWEEPTRLVPYVMSCYARGEAPKVTAGRQPRDFIYVEDVVSLLTIAAEHPAVTGRVLHAGTGRQHTVRDIIEMIAEVCGDGRLGPIYGAEPARSDEPTHWVADIERTTELTGWRPTYDLRAGVEKMWRWYRDAQPSGKLAA